MRSPLLEISGLANGVKTSSIATLKNKVVTFTVAQIMPTSSGGKGNGTIYGVGKDVIFGFENNDLLQITGMFSASSNAITLRDFTATSFNVNGYTYGITNNKFVKK